MSRLAAMILTIGLVLGGLWLWQTRETAPAPVQAADAPVTGTTAADHAADAAGSAADAAADAAAASQAAGQAAQQAVGASREATDAARASDQTAQVLTPAGFDAAAVEALIRNSALDEAQKQSLSAAVRNAASNPGTLGPVLDQVRAALR